MNDLNELKNDQTNTDENYDSFGNKLNPNLQNMSEDELQTLLNKMVLVNKKVKEHSVKWDWGL